MDGVLLVNKPKGLTSFKVVYLLRKHFNVKKVGHSGTLDPFATGLLVLLLGKATKISSLFLEDDKEYEGVMVFGKETDTYDLTGKTLKETKQVSINKQQVENIFKEFEGSIEQAPPSFSAIKIGGRKSYQLARKGLSVKHKKRKVKIFYLKLTELISNEFVKAEFTTKVSKGTYIRSLAHDIGKKLNTGAYLEELKRTASGKFKLKDACELDDMLKWDKEQLKSNLISIEQAMS